MFIAQSLFMCVMKTFKSCSINTHVLFPQLFPQLFSVTDHIPSLNIKIL